MIKRKKCFLGALIGGVLGVGSSLLSNNMSNKAAKRQVAEQQRLQNIKDAQQTAYNLSATYGDRSIVDQFSQRVIGKYGTKVKRKKCKLGWTSNDTSSVISAAANAFSNINNTISQNRRDAMTVTSKEALPLNAKTELVVPDYMNNPYYTDRLTLFRCGGRKRIR